MDYLVEFTGERIINHCCADLSFIKWESKARPDLHKNLDAGDKSALAGKDCQGICRTGILQ